MAIAKLSIDLEAKFAKLEQDLQSFSNKASGVGNNLKAAFGGILAAGAVTVITQQFKGIVDGLDKIDEAAERLSTTTEELSSLSYAAKLNGLEFEDLNKGLVKFTGLLADAKNGNEDAIKTLDRLGVSAKNYSNLEAAFSQAADGISGVNDPIKRAGLLIDAFGEKLGTKFGPMLSGGAAGLAEFRAEAEKLGGVIDGKVAKQAADFNDNLDRLSTLASAAGKSIAGGLLPYLNDIAESFIISRKNADSFWEAISRPLPGAAFVDVEANLTKIRNEYEQLDFRISNGRAKSGDEERFAKLGRELSYWQQIAEVQNNRGAQKPSNRPSDTAPNDSPKKKGGGSSKAVSFTDYEAILVERVARAIESTDLVKAAELEASLAKLQQLEAAGMDPALIQAARSELSGFAREMQAATEATIGQRQAFYDQIIAAEQAAETYGLTASQISAVEQSRLTDAIAIAQQNGASEEQIAYLEEELALRSRLTDALIESDRQGQAKSDAEAAAAKIGEMDEYFKSAARNMQSTLADFIFDPFSKGTEDMASQFGQMLQRMAAEAAAAAIMKNLFGSMGQATSGGGAGDWGWVGKAATWAGSFFADGGIMTSDGPVPLRRYAGGGVANSPQLAMFGEGATPEAYVPLPDGRAIPVKMRGSSGMTINQTIYAGQGTDSAQVRRSAASGARSALGAINGAQRYA